jgi:hypothetical protein
MKKEAVLQAISAFHKEVDLNQLVEQLLINDKIEKGLLQIEQEETLSHKEVVAHFKKKWKA